MYKEPQVEEIQMTTVGVICGSGGLETPPLHPAPGRNYNCNDVVLDPQGSTFVPGDKYGDGR